MKRCLSCHTSYEAANQNCPRCGFRPAIVNGFEAYAPEFVREGGGFKESYFSDLAKLEDANFWFISRNNLILWALDKYIPKLQSFLEIGCGTGYVLKGISKKFPSTTLVGSEIFIAGLGFASQRLPAVSLIQMDARNIPFDNEFDAIGAFDVLEHIREDEDVLTQMWLTLKPKGLVFITVPQHKWLWSSVDEYAFHERRYAASEIHHKIEATGFCILRSTSFITALLPVMMFARLSQKKYRIKKSLTPLPN